MVLESILKAEPESAKYRLGLTLKTFVHGILEGAFSISTTRLLLFMVWETGWSNAEGVDYIQTKSSANAPIMYK